MCRCGIFLMFLATLVQGYLKSDEGKKEPLDDKQEFLAVIHLFFVLVLSACQR